MVQRWKELDLGNYNIPVSLDECLTLCHDLEQYDPDAVYPSILKELEANPFTQIKDQVCLQVKD